MMLVDTNVMIYAHRLEAERHQEYSAWMEELIDGPKPYAVSDFALNGMIRIAHRPEDIPARCRPHQVALDYAELVREQPHARVVSPGARSGPSSGACAGRPDVGPSSFPTRT